MMELINQEEFRIDRCVDLNQFVEIVKAAKIQNFLVKPRDMFQSHGLRQVIFFAIQSIRDGHEFVDKLLQKKALACVL